MAKKKCEVAINKVDWLGFEINERGVKPQIEKTKAISELKSPENSKALKSFMGAVNYYTKWVPDLAKLTAPMKHLLKKNSKYEWTKTEENAFDATKQAIKNITSNSFFNIDLPCTLTTDCLLYTSPSPRDS